MNTIRGDIINHAIPKIFLEIVIANTSMNAEIARH